ncbi:SNW/SKI-interacting protein [Tanacetum coccineum]
MSMKELRMEIDDQTIIASSFVFPILKVSICYKPSQQSTALNLGANERIIRMMEMHVDTLELPKSKHKHVQKANGSPPVLVMHSPPRPVTVQNNANFAKISEALYVVEQKAREAVATRSKLQKDLMMKEKERKEQELHALTQKARSERVGPGGTVGAGTGSYTPFKKNMMDTDEPMRIEREHEHEHEHKKGKGEKVRGQRCSHGEEADTEKVNQKVGEETDSLGNGKASWFGSEKVRGNKNKVWKLWRSPSAGCGLSVSSSMKGARMEIEGGCRLRVRVIWKCRLVLMWLLWLELSPKHFTAIKKE